MAGKAGILLSALAATQQRTLPMSKVRALANAAQVNPAELHGLLGELEQQRVIQKGADGVEVLGVTTGAVLQHASGIFRRLESSQVEYAALALAEFASRQPVEKPRVGEMVSDTFELSSAETADTLQQSEAIEFVDREDVDSSTTLYFNGNIFRRDSATKIARILSGLSPSDAAKLSEIEEQLGSQACILYQHREDVLGLALLHKLVAVGYFDINRVSNNQESVSYITRPAAFSKYGNSLIEDALDLAKAFVSSLTYGMTRSYYERGEIRMITQLLSALIQGKWVGPVPAIGEDYRILELKGVVEVKHVTGRRFSMRLLKREVGELALKSLLTGDISEETVPGLSGAAVTAYARPGENRRVVRKSQISASRKSTAELLTTLRTGGDL